MRRTLIVLTILFFASNPAEAQTVEEQLREMRAEIQRLRQELDGVKQEVRKRDEAIQAVEELPLLQAQVQEHAQAKVESSSKFPLKLFGDVVSNTFVNTGEPNWLDIPNVATPATPGAPSGSFSTSLRQTRVGAIFEGPQVGRMKVNGTVAVDFFGGVPNFQTGQVMALPRLLYAYMRLDGEKTAVQIGQDHMILAPRNPTSLAGMSFPTLYRSGNLYLRVPQIRAERLVATGAAEFRAVAGVLAPVAGDFPADAYQFVPPDLAGERSRMPALQTRLSWRATPAGPYEQPRWEIGVSGHYGRERYPTQLARNWATAFDFDITAGKAGFGGEYFAGRNIDAFGGSVAQLGKSHGGFVEARLAATSRLSFNGGYGTDRLFHLGRFPAPLSRNGTVFANWIFSLTPELRAGLEYQRLVTRPMTGRTERNDHFNLTFVYSF